MKQPKIVIVHMSPLVVKTSEAAKLLDVSPKWIRALIAKGELRAFKEGQRQKVVVASIHEYIERKTANTRPGEANLQPHEIPEWMEPT